MVGKDVLRGFLSMEGEWAYRIPFSLQWVLPVPLAIGIFLAPDSPWWLARKDRMEEAEAALRALRAKDGADEEIEDTMKMIKFTVDLEKGHTTSSYKDLFNRKNIRRTEITVLTYVVQELLVPLMSYIVYFLQQAGVPTARAF